MAFTSYDFQPALQRGNEYEGLHFRALEMAAGSAGQVFNTGNTGLKYAAFALSRVGKTATTALIDQVGVFADASDPGVVEVIDGAVGGAGSGYLCLWFAGNSSSSKSATASTWSPTTGGQGIVNAARLFRGLSMGVIPVSDVSGSSVFTTDRPGVRAIAYDTRGDNTGTSHIEQFTAGTTDAVGLIMTGTANPGASNTGRVLYWYTH